MLRLPLRDPITIVRRCSRAIAALAFASAAGGCSTLMTDTGFGPATPAAPAADAKTAAPADLSGFDQAIGAKTDDLAAAYATRAEARAHQPDAAGAVADLDHYLALEPASGLAWLVRGEVRVANHEFAGAVADFSQALKLGFPASDQAAAGGAAILNRLLQSQFPGMRPSDSANAYYLRGVAEQTQGDIAGAIADFDQAITADPEFSAAFNSRGIAKSLVRDATGAVADFTSAIKLDPAAADAYANRGRILLAARNPDAALQDLNQAIQLKPEWATAYFDRASIQQRAGNLDAAIDDLSKAIALKSDYGDAYFNRAVDYDRKGNLAAALDDYNKLVGLQPEAPDAYANRGVDKYRQGDMDGAIADFSKAIALKRDFVKAYLERAVADRLKGDTAGAIADYGKVIELADRETAMYPQLFRSVFMREAHGDTAPQDFIDLVAGWPDGWAKRLGSYLGGSLTEADLLDQADRAEAKTASAHHCDACYFIGMNDLIAGKTDAAKDYFQKCTATGRDDLFAFKFAQSELARLAPPTAPAQ